MSEFGDILAAVSSAITTAVPAYTAQTGFTSIEKVRVEQYPFAMVYNPSGQNDALDFRQVRRTVTVTVVCIRAAGDGATLYQDADSIRDRLETDFTLGGLVDRLTVTSVELDEDTRPGKTVAVLTVETEREV